MGQNVFCYCVGPTKVHCASTGAVNIYLNQYFTDNVAAVFQLFLAQSEAATSKPRGGDM